MFSACSLIPEFNPTDALSDAEYTPYLTPTAAPEPTPAPTPYSVNPVHAFYMGYRSAAAPCLSRFFAALREAKGLDCARLSLSLTRHGVCLSEIYSTVCRLISDESGGYSGSISGTENGSGSLYPGVEDGSYTFSFLYDDGSTLSGVLAVEGLSFSVHSPDNAPIIECEMLSTGAGYTASVEEAGHIYIFSFDGGESTYTVDGEGMRLTPEGALDAIVPLTPTTEE